eukprot:TRINITY_DN19406_c0_g1_i1.p4 TRINITY_DN19406_c0_g1~~TRINITY_DN19406_c0_g1_i1.p4  ORF type:complete len:113 (-),score=24.49 TRINITY_DN19406_c0_g1_i1:64-354(-)
MVAAMMSLTKPGVVAKGVFAPQHKRAQLPVRRMVVRAQQSQESSVDVDKLVDELKTKWDAVENKTNVAVYAAGAVAALWASSTIVGAVNSVPLLGR